MESEPTLAQFPLVRVTPDADGSTGIARALDNSGDPAELLLVEEPTLAATLLLIDTPDFDSILEENRRASESLLQVVDLAIVVVTRHTYQNKEVVGFLESWLAHGRPWMLVYNESLGATITSDHADKLAHDLGSEPVAVFHAPFDLEVAQGSHTLEPTGLRGTGVEVGQPLGLWLGDFEQAGDLKRRALASSLAQLRGEVVEVQAELRECSADAHRVLETARRATHELGLEVASRAMPMGPFLQAFRAVLDRRPSLLQRGLRGVLRRGRLVMERVVERLPFVGSTKPETSELGLEDVEREALERSFPQTFERLARELQPAVLQERLGKPLTPAVAAALATDLAPDAGDAARGRVIEAVGRDAEVLADFERACEELIERELDARDSEWFLQLAVDVVHVLPAMAAGLVIVKTGGLGTDLAVGGAGAVSSLLAEKISGLLGTRVAQEARESWTRLRGEQLSGTLLQGTLAQSATLLEDEVSECARLADELEQHFKEVRWDSAVTRNP